MFSTLSCKSVSNCALTADIDESILWHKGLGHYIFSSLKFVYAKSLVNDFLNIDVVKEVCKACQLSKFYRATFLSKSS